MALSKGHGHLMYFHNCPMGYTQYIKTLTQTLVAFLLIYALPCVLSGCGVHDVITTMRVHKIVHICVSL